MGVDFGYIHEPLTQEMMDRMQDAKTRQARHRSY